MQNKKDSEEALKQRDTAKEAHGKLNKDLHEFRDRFKKEKASILGEHQSDIKMCKKDYDEANNEIIKLKKKIDDLGNKEAELEEFQRANAGLEEIVISPSDTLYGCEECGRHGVTATFASVVLMWMNLMILVREMMRQLYPTLIVPLIPILHLHLRLPGLQYCHTYPHLAAPQHHGHHLPPHHAAAVGARTTGRVLTIYVLVAFLH